MYKIDLTVKTLTCVRCMDKVFIPYNQVGGLVVIKAVMVIFIMVAIVQNALMN